MPIRRIAVGWQLDTAFPRDALWINPTFNVQTLGGVADQALADDLCTAIKSWTVPNCQVTTKVYDREAEHSHVSGGAPVLPLATKVLGSGLSPQSGLPRELAVCLSFYSQPNTPRRRGRLFVPACATGGATLTEKISSTMRTKIAALVPIFTNLGGANVDWGVYSMKDGAFRKATDWFIDDDWDVQRRRGLKTTTRTTGTTGE